EAGAAADRVVAATADDDVVAAIAGEHVVGIVAGDLIIAAAAAGVLDHHAGDTLLVGECVGDVARNGEAVTDDGDAGQRIDPPGQGRHAAAGRRVVERRRTQIDDGVEDAGIIDRIDPFGVPDAGPAHGVRRTWIGKRVDVVAAIVAGVGAVELLHRRD